MSNNIITEILMKYTSGEYTQDEANAKLIAAGSNLRLDVGKNIISPEEISATVVGETTESVNGWGLIDQGLGTMQKAQVVSGVVVNGCAASVEGDPFYIGGKVFIMTVDGKLANV